QRTMTGEVSLECVIDPMEFAGDRQRGRAQVIAVALSRAAPVVVEIRKFVMHAAACLERDSVISVRGGSSHEYEQRCGVAVQFGRGHAMSFRSRFDGPRR